MIIYYNSSEKCIHVLDIVHKHSKYLKVLSNSLKIHINY